MVTSHQCVIHNEFVPIFTAEHNLAEILAVVLVVCCCRLGIHMT